MGSLAGLGARPVPRGTATSPNGHAAVADGLGLDIGAGKLLVDPFSSLGEARQRANASPKTIRRYAPVCTISRRFEGRRDGTWSRRACGPPHLCGDLAGLSTPLHGQDDRVVVRASAEAAEGAVALS